MRNTAILVAGMAAGGLLLAHSATADPLPGPSPHTRPDPELTQATATLRNLVSQLRSDSCARDLPELAKLEPLFARAGGLVEQAWIWSSRGACASSAGDLTQAKEYYERALELYHRDMRLNQAEAVVLGKIGAILNETNQPAQARAYLQHAMFMSRLTGARDTEGCILLELGRTDFMEHQPTAAIAKNREALEVLDGSKNYCRQRAILNIVALYEAIRPTDFSRMAAELAKLSRLAPELFEVRLGLAEALIGSGRYAEVAAVMEPVLGAKDAQDSVVTLVHQVAAAYYCWLSALLLGRPTELDTWAKLLEQHYRELPSTIQMGDIENSELAARLRSASKKAAEVSERALAPAGILSRPKSDDTVEALHRILTTKAAVTPSASGKAEAGEPPRVLPSAAGP